MTDNGTQGSSCSAALLGLGDRSRHCTGQCLSTLTTSTFFALRPRQEKQDNKRQTIVEVPKSPQFPGTNNTEAIRRSEFNGLLRIVSLHTVIVMHAFNRGGRRRQPTPANVQCQKCLKRGHYSYECKAQLLERPYKARPSRTQQLLNPKLAPKLTNDVPDDITRKWVNSQAHTTSALFC